MRILLVRHGESLGNVDPMVHATTADHAVPLSERGHQQALEAGARVADYFERSEMRGGDPAGSAGGAGSEDPRGFERSEMRGGDPAGSAGGAGSKAPRGIDQRVVGPRPHVRLWVSPYHRTRQTADAVVETSRGWITDRVEHILLCEQQFGLFDGVPEAELPARFPNEFGYYDMQCRFGGKFWARMPQGESRFDVAKRIHQAFGTFHRDAAVHDIRDIVVICHGVTLRAFVMMWCHLAPEWFEAEANPNNCAIRLVESGVDRGYIFNGFPRQPAPPSRTLPDTTPDTTR